MDLHLKDLKSICFEFAEGTMAFSSLDPDVLKSVSALPQPFQAVFSFRYKDRQDS